MQSVDIEAKTAEEAIERACQELNATREELNIEIIEQSGMIRSLFSGKKARIRATRISASAPFSEESAVHQLREILETIARRIYPEATVSAEQHDGEIFLIITGDGSGIFIGKHGQTLEALQYLMNKIRLSRFRDLPHIQVDSEAYRERHLAGMIELANRMSDKAKKRGAPVCTNPLNPGDRRIIHMTLKPDPELTTWSKGNGNLKKVFIAPRQAAQA